MVCVQHATSRKKASLIPLPSAAERLLLEFSGAFSRPTYARWLILVVGAIVTTGRRTVQNTLRTVEGLAPGHWSSYHRVLSRRRWSSWPLARVLARLILDRFAATGVVALVGDDTVDEHRGKKVYGKACHRDAVRSTRSFTAYRWGHKWVVLSILVRLPFASRPWALPVLVALYRSMDWNKKHGRRHKTPVDLMRQLLAVFLRWFPERRFTFAGDGGFSTHDLAAFGHRHRERLTVVGRFYANARLYAPPPPKRASGPGRPRIRGEKLPCPKERVKTARKRRLNVGWYGGGRRDVRVATDTGRWYRGGQGLVPVRWIHVEDLTGTHRSELFFTTDLGMALEAIIETYTGRWSIETTFQEARAYLGLETTCGRTESTVLRAAPSLLCLYSVIVLLYASAPARFTRAASVAWHGKKHLAFADAVASVRRWLWLTSLFSTPHSRTTLQEFPRALRQRLLHALAPAA